MENLVFNTVYRSFEEQLNIFESRGIIIEDRSKALERIKSINYYKIKEFSMPFVEKVDENGKIIYKSGTTFKNITDRFYEDKNLRLHLLRILEKFEISFKTQFAHLLGKKHAAFGYLDFFNWVDRKDYCRHYIKLKENDFKNRLSNNIKKTKNSMVKDYLENTKIDEIPIWLVVEIMTFGEIIELYELMFIDYKKHIVKYYKLDISTFKNWIENLKLIRNMAAHNSNIVDLRFITKPRVKKEWRDILYHTVDSTGTIIYTNKIATTIMILNEIIPIINADFPGGGIRKILRRLANKTDEGAKLLGFKDFESISKLTI